MIILVQLCFECNLHLTLQWPTCDVVYSLKVESIEFLGCAILSESDLPDFYPIICILYGWEIDMRFSFSIIHY